MLFANNKNKFRSIWQERLSSPVVDPILRKCVLFNLNQRIANSYSEIGFVPLSKSAPQMQNNLL